MNPGHLPNATRFFGFSNIERENQPYQFSLNPRALNRRSGAQRPHRHVEDVGAAEAGKGIGRLFLSFSFADCQAMARLSDTG